MLGQAVPFPIIERDLFDKDGTIYKEHKETNKNEFQIPIRMVGTRIEGKRLCRQSWLQSSWSFGRLRADRYLQHNDAHCAVTSMPTVPRTVQSTDTAGARYSKMAHDLER